MHTCTLILIAAVGASIPLPAQTPTRPPQTARQALIEMFLGGETDAFAKHLPEAARRLLVHNGQEQTTSILFRISTLGRQMLPGGHVETFDEGPTILISEQDQRERVEVSVEHDVSDGENDEIELSVHHYRDGQERPLPVIPRLIFSLRQEKEIWRLAEFTAAANIPLADTNYLRGVRRQLQEGNESSAQMRIHNIAHAESGYAEEHPDRGYTCSMSLLFTPTADASSEDNTDPPQVFYDPGQGNVEWNGYRFALTGCEGSQGTKYQITAVPLDSDSGSKTFCADESGTVKSVTGVKVSACFSRGEVVSSRNDSGMESNE